MSKDFIEVESALDKKLQLRHLPITKTIDNFVLRVGEIFNWLWVALVAVIILNVVLRYVFKNGRSLQIKVMSTSQEITAEEARQQLLEVWTECEFGVKERVKKVHSSRTIHYILTTPTYSNTSKILEIIECVKEQVEIVKNEVIEMDKKIQSIN